MGGVDGEVVGQREDAFLQRSPQRAGQRLGLVIGDQIGSGDRVDKQRAPGEQRDLVGAVGQQPAQMLGRVPGRADGLQP